MSVETYLAIMLMMVATDAAMCVGLKMKFKILASVIICAFWPITSLAMIIVAVKKNGAGVDNA